MWTVKRLMIQFRLCIALLVLFCGSSLPAAAANPGDGDEALRAAALKLQLKTRAMEERLLGSPAEVLSVYVGVLPGQMSAVSATATVDGQPLASHDFMPIEAQALAGDALYRLGRVRLDPGPHHIDVEIVARSTADAAAAPRRFAAQLDYNKTPGAAALEVVPDGAVWPWSPRMLIVPLQVRAAPQSTAAKLLSTIKAVGPAADGRYLPGGADDPVLRYAEFLTAARQYLEAAVQLSLLQDRVESGSLDPAYEVAWSEALTRYGLLAQAGAPLLQATAGGADPHSVQTARHDLAEAFYGRGDWSAAWDTLGGETPPSKASERGPWRDLACRILLAQGRLNEAAGLLRDADTAADFDAYVRYYNLGVALVASGDVGQGLTVLERVGSVLSNDPQMTALSDRANLAAGIHFLKIRQGATAISILEQMHSEGPYSSLGLLNLGWAWLAPPGTVQEKVMLGDERTLGPPPEAAYENYAKHDQNLYQRYDLGTFSRTQTKQSAESRRGHALSLWTFLADHRAGDEEGQEAMLAIAVEQQSAGAAAQAIASYDRAGAALAQSIADIHRARQYVESPAPDADLFAPPSADAFDRSPHALPPLPAAYYLSDVLASSPFQAQFGNLRDMLALDRAMSALQLGNDRLAQRYCGASDSAPPSSPDQAVREAEAGLGPAQRVCQDIEDLRPSVAGLRAQLAAAAEADKSLLRQQLLDALTRQENWRNKLLTDARFELARLYDSAIPP